jgi:hypothetical protein
MIESVNAALSAKFGEGKYVTASFAQSYDPDLGAGKAEKVVQPQGHRPLHLLSLQLM